MQNDKTMKFLQIVFKTIRYHATKTGANLADLAAIDMIATIGLSAIDREASAASAHHSNEYQDRDNLREGRDPAADLADRL